jgi:Transposase DDE domain group 1
LLLGATDRAIGMMERFASCFDDRRRPDLIEHEVVTLVGQRVFGIALGYEDLKITMSCVMIRSWRSGGQAGSTARRLCAGGRKVDTQSAGTEQTGADAVPQN